MSYLKNFDQILADILTDYENLSPAPDTSKGSMAFIKAACSAAALWGIYKYQDFISKQAVPGTAIGKDSGGTLDDWAALFDIYRGSGDTDSDLLESLLTRLRQPPAGGNSADYIQWAKEVEGVSKAWVYTDDNAQGLGTVDVVASGPTGSEVLDAPKLLEIYNYIDARRPAGSYLLRVLPIVTLPTDVTMTLNGGTAVPFNVTLEITSYLNSLAPGQTLYLSQLIAIAIGQGALNPIVTVPAADVVPSSSNHEMIIAGSIGVS